MDRGVIYLGHIPHGFYENEMRQYFSQFGTVTRLKLARSKKVRLLLEGTAAIVCLVSSHSTDWWFQRVRVH